MKTAVIKFIYTVLMPVVLVIQVAVGVKLRFTRCESDYEGTPILSLQDSAWGFLGMLAYGLSPAFTCPDGSGNPVIVLLRRKCLGVVLHEGGHCHYGPAQPTSMTEVKRAHEGKGARFEHQADKYAVLKLREWGAPREEFEKYIEFLEGAPGDGPYRAKMLKRFIRRYKIA